MELIESGSEGSSQTALTQSSLISGLPDDIALTCLARIPRRYHSLLKCVSRKWRDLVCSEEWYSYRQKHNLAETWIYALCKDKSEQLCCYVLDPNLPKKGWKRIPDLSPCCLKRKGVGFEVLGKKIYFLGGCGWVEDATDEVYCYDASRNDWSEASPLSTARCYFACEAMNGKMYAIGGLGSKSSDPHSWDTFDSNTNSWTSHMDPNIVPEIEDSLVLDGKIYIRCGFSAVSRHVYAVVYDPLNGTWQHADADMVSGWRGPGIVVEDTLYVLDQSSGTRVMMWRNDRREWEAFGRLAAVLTRPPCRVVAIGRKMFVVGKGLSTVVFDVDKAANIDGMLVTTSVPKVLQIPDFRTSKAAREINQQMKVLIKLYEDMTSETNTMEKCKNTKAHSIHDQKKSTEVKPAEPPLENKKTFIRKSSEERPATVEEGSHGSYVVGGSAFGWNFVTYPGSKSTGYYGTTKEDFRAANPIPTYAEKVE